MAASEVTQASDRVDSLSQTERALASLWVEVLQITSLPKATDDFFALGGDSMGMTLLEFRVQEELSVELPAGALLGAPTLRQLAALIDEAP